MAASTKTFLNNNPPACEDDDLNGFILENNNLIEGSGQTLSTADNQQTHKAVVQYSTDGDFFSVGGSVNAYTMTALSAKESPVAYTQGMRVRGVFGTPNTGASTLNVDSLGVKDIKTEAGFDPAPGAISGFTEFYYDGTNFVKVEPQNLSPYTGFKNRIIGGDFSLNPWQRGTTFTGVANGTYTADRFILGSITSAVVDILRTADAPTVSEAGVFTQHCLHIDVTTADTSIAVSDFMTINQVVEGYNSADFGFGQSGTRYVTLSFWHKHTKTGTYCLSVRATGGTRAYIKEYTQSASDVWEKATLIIPVDTTGTWDYTNGAGLNLSWTLAAGTNYHGSADTWQSANVFATTNQVNALDSTSNNFKIALVQLERGQVATPFEKRSYQQERYLCERYLQTYLVGGASNLPGFNDSATAFLGHIKYNQLMRASPTLNYLDGSVVTNLTIRYALASGTSSAVTSASISGNSYGARFSATSSGLTSGQGCVLDSNGTDVLLGFDAEL